MFWAGFASGFFVAFALSALVLGGIWWVTTRPPDVDTRSADVRAFRERNKW